MSVLGFNMSNENSFHFPFFPFFFLRNCKISEDLCGNPLQLGAYIAFGVHAEGAICTNQFKAAAAQAHRSISCVNEPTMRVIRILHPFQSLISSWDLAYSNQQSDKGSMTMSSVY
jgi:hypothetical protein